MLDLSWSSKDQYLASCSVDNTVIIWNALKFPGIFSFFNKLFNVYFLVFKEIWNIVDIIYRINAHAGLVKGVAWDPVGNYLASQVYKDSLQFRFNAFLHTISACTLW